MDTWFVILTVAFIIVSAAMVLIILVQRPQGGGLAGAFGGAGGGGTETVFGGRVGDALTVMTVVAFLAYLGLAISLNLMDSSGQTTAQPVNAGDPPLVTAEGTTPIEGAGTSTTPLVPTPVTPAPFDAADEPSPTPSGP